MRSVGLWIDDSVMIVIIVVCAGVALLGVLRPADDDAAPARERAGQLVDARRGHGRAARGVADHRRRCALIAVGLVLVGASRGVSSGRARRGVRDGADDPRRDGAARSVAGQGGAGDHRRAAPTHPPRRTRGDGRPPARLGAADPRPHPAHGRRPAAHDHAGPPAGGRAAPVAVRQRRHGGDHAGRERCRRWSTRSRTSTTSASSTSSSATDRSTSGSSR